MVCVCVSVCMGGVYVCMVCVSVCVVWCMYLWYVCVVYGIYLAVLLFSCDMWYLIP